MKPNDYEHVNLTSIKIKELIDFQNKCMELKREYKYLKDLGTIQFSQPINELEVVDNNFLEPLRMNIDYHIEKLKEYLTNE